MKKLLALALAVASSNLLASTPQFFNLSDSDVKDVSREFSATFSHTGVSAPETDGLWGLEVGALAGQSKTPDLKDVVANSGGNGNDFKNLYHAGAMARAHFPLDLFAEVTILPEQTISDIKVKNRTFEIGWNAGGFFNLPLDVAIGMNFANSDLSFKQDPVGSILTNSKISINSKTQILWVGISKSFAIFTPYVKVGHVSSDSTVKATGDIFASPASTSKDASNNGSYLTAGANLQLAIFKLGVEAAQIMNVQRASAKISLDF